MAIAETKRYPLSDSQNFKCRFRDGGRKNEKRTMIEIKICTRVFGVADNSCVIRFS